MVAIICLVLFFNLQMFHAIASTYNNYTKKTVFSIEYGENNNQVTVCPDGEGANAVGPMQFYIGNDNRLYILDYCAQRVKIFNDDNSLAFQTPKLSGLTLYYIDQNHQIHAEHSGNVTVFSDSGMVISKQNRLISSTKKGFLTIQAKNKHAELTSALFNPMPQNLYTKNIDLRNHGIANYSYILQDKFKNYYVVWLSTLDNPIVFFEGFDIKIKIHIHRFNKNWALLDKISYPAMPGFGHYYDKARIDENGNIYYLEFEKNCVNVVKYEIISK